MKIVNPIDGIETSFDQFEGDIKALRLEAIQPLVAKLLDCFEAQGYSLPEVLMVLDWVVSDRHGEDKRWHGCIRGLDEAWLKASKAEQEGKNNAA